MIRAEGRPDRRCWIWGEGAILGMGRHPALHVDNLAKPKAMESLPSPEAPESSDCASASHASMAAWPSISTVHSAVGEKNVAIDVPEEEEPLIQGVECRICQEEDSIKNLDTPCVCSGSLKVSTGVFFLFFLFYLLWNGVGLIDLWTLVMCKLVLVCVFLPLRGSIGSALKLLIINSQHHASLLHLGAQFY